jgi:hypothetical protein
MNLATGVVLTKLLTTFLKLGWINNKKAQLQVITPIMKSTQVSMFFTVFLQL